MKTASLEVLRKAELQPGHAQAILTAMEIELGTAHEALATKVDLVDLKAELRREMLELKQELGREITGIREDLLGLRAELKGDLGRMEGDLGRMEGSSARWVLSCILAQTAVLVGAGYFVLEHLRR